MTNLDGDIEWQFKDICAAGSNIMEQRTSHGVLEALLKFAQTSSLVDESWCSLQLFQHDEIPLAQYPPHWPKSFIKKKKLIAVSTPFIDDRLTKSARKWLVASSFKSAVFLPIQAYGTQFAEVGLFSKTTENISESTISVIKHLTDIASMAIARTWLFRERLAIQQYSQDMAHAISADDAIQTTLNLLNNNLSLSSGNIFLLSAESTLQLHTTSQEVRFFQNASVEELNFPTSTVIITPRARKNPLNLPKYYSSLNNGNTFHQLLLLPIFNQKTLKGAVALEHNTESRSFSPEEVEFATLVVDLLNTTLENLSLFDELLRRAQELISLNQVSEKISSTLNNRELAEIVHLEIQNLTSCRVFLLAMVETGSLHIQPLLMVDGMREILLDPVPLRPDSDFYWAIRELETVLVEAGDPIMRSIWDIVSDSTDLDSPPINCIFSPMAHGGIGYGFMAIFADDIKPFTPDDIQIVRAVSHQAALGLANSALLVAEQTHVSELRSLFNVTRAMATGITSDDRVTGMIRTLHSSLNQADISVFMLGSGGALELVGWQGDRPAIPQEGNLAESLIGRVLLEKGTQYQPNLNSLMPSEKIGSEGFGSQIALPITISGELAGILNAQHAEVGMLSERELRLLQSVSVSLASTLENGRLFREIQEANARLKALDELKTKFLANMSHELRTPLNSIIGFSRIMMKGMNGPVTDEQYIDLESIYNSGQHLLNLINDILDLAKLEAGKMALVFDEIDLFELANSVMVTTRGLVHDQNVELHISIDPLATHIIGDKIRLRQILLNLLSNAAKFTHNGSITLSTKPSDSEEMVLICVEDSGAGIDEATLPRIFDIFEQGRNAVYPESSGTGLGLSIVRELVQLHQGKITVESKIDEGTCFYLHMPRQQEGYQSESPGSSLKRSASGVGDSTPEVEESHCKQAILLVDDDPIIFKLYHKYLSRMPIELISASNGVDALELLNDERYDVVMIILDLHMPEMDGWETLKQIKLTPGTDHIPVIISSVEPDRKKAAELEIEYVLPKPVKYADLQKLTLKALGQLDVPA
ncbi:MAG: ATP-binding protein [Chloroflexota bacterium]